MTVSAINSVQNRKSAGRMILPREKFERKFRVEVWERTTEFQKYTPRVNGERVVKIDPEDVFHLASLGLSQGQIASVYGLKYNEFGAVFETYPDIEDALMMGRSAGIVKAADALDKNIEDGDTLSIMFKLKCSGDWLEAEKRPTVKDSGIRPQLYLPEIDQ